MRGAEPHGLHRQPEQQIAERNVVRDGKPCQALLVHQTRVLPMESAVQVTAEDEELLSCFYLGPPRDHPRDSLRVLTRGGDVIETRDVTWEPMSS